MEHRITTRFCSLQWAPLHLLFCFLLSGCDVIPDIPVGNGYAAKNICSGLFISDIDRSRLVHRYVAPQVAPLQLIWRIDVDEAAQTVRVYDIVFQDLFAATAYYREGIGCTLLHDWSTAKLDLQLPPQSPPPDHNGPWPLGNGGASQSLPDIDYEQVERALDDAFVENRQRTRNTAAVAVVYRNRLIAERYLEESNIDANTPLTGWSMTKSLTGTWIGLLQDRGLLDVTASAPVPEWKHSAKNQITLENLLHMNAGLEWAENATGPDNDQGYILHRTTDFAQYYLDKPQAEEPGSTFRYSTGASSLIARIAQDALGGDPSDSYHFLQQNLFQPLHMHSAILEYDTVGQPGGGSYLWLTARDWARFGLLYLREGDWFGQQVLSTEWIHYMKTPATTNSTFGAHIWLNTDQQRFPSLPENTFGFFGHQDQSVVIVPDYDLIVVRLGFTFEGDAFDVENLVNAVIAGLEPNE